MFPFHGLIVLAAAFAVIACTPEPKAAPKQPPKRSLEPLKNSVVRLYVDGRYAGSGVVISQDGRIVTARRILKSRTDKPRITVDDGVVTATLVAEDAPHDLALIKADKTYVSAAQLETRSNVGAMDSAVIIGFSEILGEPPMVEKRSLEGFVSKVRYSGESVSGLDLSDISMVTGRINDRVRIEERGAAIFMEGSRKLLGIGIGKTWSSDEIMVMPAETIKALISR